ncbi:MAG: hypothetical protein ACOC1P_00405 [Minisyncoccales bacterium]
MSKDFDLNGGTSKVYIIPRDLTNIKEIVTLELNLKLGGRIQSYYDPQEFYVAEQEEVEKVGTLEDFIYQKFTWRSKQRK